MIMAHLEGRTILVTGGSRGIGAAIMEALARDGANVVIHYGRDRAKAEELLERIDGRGITLSQRHLKALWLSELIDLAPQETRNERHRTPIHP